MPDVSALLVNPALHDRYCETMTWTASSAFCGCALRRELRLQNEANDMLGKERDAWQRRAGLLEDALRVVTAQRDRAIEWIADECRIRGETAAEAQKRLGLIMTLIQRSPVITERKA